MGVASVNTRKHKWCVPVSPALRGQRQADLRKVTAGLHRMFQADIRPCFKKKSAPPAISPAQGGPFKPSSVRCDCDCLGCPTGQEQSGCKSFKPSQWASENQILLGLCKVTAQKTRLLCPLSTESVGGFVCCFFVCGAKADTDADTGWSVKL